MCHIQEQTKEWVVEFCSELLDKRLTVLRYMVRMLQQILSNTISIRLEFNPSFFPPRSSARTSFISGGHGKTANCAKVNVIDDG